MDERSIIEDIKNSENWAVEEMVDRYGDRLVKSAYMVCGDLQLAEEAVQN